MSFTTTKEAEEFARIALGSRALKNRRVRRAIVARLLNENGDGNKRKPPSSPRATTMNRSVPACDSQLLTSEEFVTKNHCGH